MPSLCLNTVSSPFPLSLFSVQSQDFPSQNFQFFFSFTELHTNHGPLCANAITFQILSSRVNVVSTNLWACGFCVKVCVIIKFKQEQHNIKKILFYGVRLSQLKMTQRCSNGFCFVYVYIKRVNTHFTSICVLPLPILFFFSPGFCPFGFLHFFTFFFTIIYISIYFCLPLFNVARRKSHYFAVNVNFGLLMMERMKRPTVVKINIMFTYFAN